MIDLTISTRVLSFDFSIDEDAFGALVKDLGDLGEGFGGVLDGFAPETIASIDASGVQWAWTDAALGAVTLDLSGFGLGPVDDAAAFLAALQDGSAIGGVSGIVLAVEGAPLVGLTLGTETVAVTLGAYALTIDGAFPTDLGDLGGFLPTFLTLADGLADGEGGGLFDLADRVFEDTMGVSVTGITLSNGTTDLLALTQTPTEISLEVAGGLSVVATGTFPGDLLTLGEAALSLIGPLLGGIPDPDGPTLEGIVLDDLVIEDARGMLLQATGDFSEPEFLPIRVMGTEGRDVANMQLLNLLGEGVTTRVFAGGGADRITGTSGRDVMDGGAGNDVLRGMAGRDLLKGAGGNDMLMGMAGRDVLLGGRGADTLDGGRGNDRLTGNAGPDVFVFLARTGHDTITDFDNNRDRVQLDAQLWGGEDLTARQVVRRFGEVNDDGDVVLAFDGRNSITFEGISARGVLTDDIDII